MLALVNRDMTEAGRSLNTLCENYRYYDQELLSFENFSALRLTVFTILPVGCWAKQSFQGLKCRHPQPFSESSPYGNEIIITLPENKH